MVQRSMHLCQMPRFKHFQDHFKARYDAKDTKMFSSPFLTFDFDDERDAIYKARAFVE